MLKWRKRYGEIAHNEAKNRDPKKRTYLPVFWRFRRFFVGDIGWDMWSIMETDFLGRRWAWHRDPSKTCRAQLTVTRLPHAS